MSETGTSQACNIHLLYMYQTEYTLNISVDRAGYLWIARSSTLTTLTPVVKARITIAVRNGHW